MDAATVDGNKNPVKARCSWIHSGKLTHSWLEWLDPDWVDVIPIENGDSPASYVSLLEGYFFVEHMICQGFLSWAQKNDAEG